MNEDHLHFLMILSVSKGTLKKVQDTFNKYPLIVQDKSFFDYELLKIALKRKHIGIINHLLKLGCRVRNPNAVNSELETALHLAMKVNNAGIIQKIIKYGASIDEKDHNGETALYAAFLEGHRTAVKEILTFVSTFTCKHLEGIDPKNTDHIRHFQIACVTDHYDAVKYYLKYDFDVNNPLILNSAEFLGSNLLHYAASEKLSRKLFEILLERGADISIKNRNGQTPLQIIYYSDFVGFRYLIKCIFHKGNNSKYINSVDDNGVSHFHMSCAVNYSEYAQVFIDNGVDVNRPISSNCSKYPGYTPLHIAVMHGCEKVVKLLVENGADCNKGTTDGTTPLHLACNLIRGELKYSIIIDMLLEYHACPAAVDKNNCTPLHLTFWNLHPYKIKLKNILDKLVPKMPREINNFTDNEGLSHFHIVCIANDTSRINDFLQSGVDINSCVLSKMFSGYTALHFAVLYNQKDAVQELLKWNAQVNIQINNLQLTPLHLACNCDYKRFLEVYIQGNESLTHYYSISNCLETKHEIVKFLLYYGADVDAQDFLGQTPLLLVCQISSADNLNTPELHKRKKRIIEVLLLNNANINACTKNQDTILHIIIKNKYLSDTEELVEYILTNGANVHAKNNAGFTPLHVAVTSHNTKLLKIFLKHQADVNAKSKNCLIPLQMIIEYDSFTNEAFISSSTNDLISLLLEHGSYFNVRSEDSKPLLQIAIECRNTLITSKLLYYGADINMEDSSGKSTVSSLFDSDGSRESKVSFATVFQIVFIHVQKLLALGRHVSEKVQTCCSNLHEHYQSVLAEVSDNDLKNIDNVFENCLEELLEMKLIKIDIYTSLYNIIQKDAHEISKHVRNSKLFKILTDPNMDNNFPLYSSLLKFKYKKGLKRRNVLKLAEEALRRIIKLNLPDLCCDSVFKYFSDEDIINLKVAASINNYKRKSNDSCNAESSVKLRRSLQQKQKYDLIVVET